MNAKYKLKMETENKNEIEVQDVMLDLDSEEDFNSVYDEVQNVGKYFRPETDMSYRVILTDSRIMPVEKVFNEGTDKEQHVKKYALNVKTVNKNKEEYEGVWEVGSATLRKIMDAIKESGKKTTESYFRLKKTGSGLNTDYDIMSDEF